MAGVLPSERVAALLLLFLLRGGQPGRFLLATAGMLAAAAAMMAAVAAVPAALGLFLLPYSM